MKTITILLLVLSMNVFCQGLRDMPGVGEVVPFKSSSTYDRLDLSFLRRILIGKDVVFLGELSHADGSSGKEKLKVIQYLHDSLGYNILIDESNYFSTDLVWKKISGKNDSTTRLLSKLLFGANEIAEDDFYLGKYLDACIRKGHPLIHQGIDIVGDLSYFPNIYIELDSMVGFYFGEKDSLLLKTLNRFLLKGTWDNSIKDLNSLQQWFLERDFNTLKMAGDSIKTALWLKIASDSIPEDNDKLMHLYHMVDNLIGYYAFITKKFTSDVNSKWLSVPCTNIRDYYMAKNLLWLIKYKYPGEKIIVSTSTYHVSKNINKQPASVRHLLQGVTTMGELLKDSLKSSYSIAFVRLEGAIGFNYIPNVFNNKVKQILVGKSRCLEQKLGKFSDYSFVDLDHTKAIKFRLNSIFDKTLSAKWSQVVDGLYFIRVMEPVNILRLNNYQKDEFIWPQGWTISQ